MCRVVQCRAVDVGVDCTRGGSGGMDRIEHLPVHELLFTVYCPDRHLACVHHSDEGDKIDNTQRRVFYHATSLHPNKPKPGADPP